MGLSQLQKPIAKGLKGAVQQVDVALRLKESVRCCHGEAWGAMNLWMAVLPLAGVLVRLWED